MLSQFEFLAEVVSALDEAGIAYMIAGSVASTHHGEPRMTRDIDLVIDPDERSVEVFVERLDPARFYIGDFTTALADRDMFNIIDTTGGWKVDLMVRKARPFSSMELSRRERADVGGINVYVATAEDTILTKLEWHQMGGSDRQMADVVSMLEAQGETLDEGYLDNWAHELGVVDELNQARALAR